MTEISVSNLEEIIMGKRYKDMKKYVEEIDVQNQAAEEAVETVLKKYLLDKIGKNPAHIFNALVLYKYLLMGATMDFICNDDLFPQEIHKEVAKICEYKGTEKYTPSRGSNYFVDILKVQPSEEVEKSGNSLILLALELIKSMAKWYPTEYDNPKKSSIFKKEYDRLITQKVVFPSEQKYIMIKKNDEETFMEKYKIFLSYQEDEKKQQIVQQKAKVSETKKKEEKPQAKSKDADVKVNKPIQSAAVKPESKGKIQSDVKPEPKKVIEQPKLNISNNGNSLNVPSSISNDNSHSDKSKIKQSESNQGDSVTLINLPSMLQSLDPKKSDVKQSQFFQKMIVDSKNTSSFVKFEQSEIMEDSDDDKSEQNIKETVKSPSFIAGKNSLKQQKPPVVKEIPVSKESSKIPAVSVNNQASKPFDEAKQSKKEELPRVDSINQQQPYSFSQKDQSIIKQAPKPSPVPPQPQVKPPAQPQIKPLVKPPTQPQSKPQVKPSAQPSKNPQPQLQPKSQSQNKPQTSQQPQIKANHYAQQQIKIKQPQKVDIEIKKPQQNLITPRKKIFKMQKIKQTVSAQLSPAEPKKENQAKPMVLENQRTKGVSIPKTQRRHSINKANQTGMMKQTVFDVFANTPSPSKEDPFNKTLSYFSNARKRGMSTELEKNWSFAQAIDRMRLDKRELPYYPKYFEPITSQMQMLRDNSLNLYDSGHSSGVFFINASIQARLTKQSQKKFNLTFRNVSNRSLVVQSVDMAQIKYSNRIKILSWANKREIQPYQLDRNGYMDVKFLFEVYDLNFKFATFYVKIEGKEERIVLPITLLDMCESKNAIQFSELQKYSLQGSIFSLKISLKDSLPSFLGGYVFPTGLQLSRHRKQPTKIVGQCLLKLEKANRYEFYVNQLLVMIRIIDWEARLGEISVVYQTKQKQGEDFAKVILYLIVFLMGGI